MMGLARMSLSKHEAPPPIVMVPDGVQIRFLDGSTSEELLSFRALDAGDVAPVSANVAAAVSGLVPASAMLLSQLADANALEVVFSPAVMAGLRSNIYRFMESGGESLAHVVDENGKVVEVGRLVTPHALSAARVAPMMLVGAVGAVGAIAAYQQQRWLEQSLGEIEASVRRVEQRLRDDDHAALAASNAIADLVELAFEADEWSDQLGMELAQARLESERILLSRQRFVERLGRELDAAAQAEEGAEARSAVLRELRDELKSQKAGLVEELATFFGAIVVRGRLNALTATAMIQQGSPRVAYEMVASVGTESRERFWPVFRRLDALSRPAADHGSGLLDRVRGTARDLFGADPEEDMAALRQLVTSTRPIGDRLLDQTMELRIAVPTGQLEIEEARS